MSDMTTAGIIERLEKATGPDEELDRAIFDTVTGGVFGPENAKFWHSTSALSRAANEFTRSIDAALTLVPEGWGVAGLSNIMLDPKYYNVRAATGWSCVVDKIGNDYSHDLMRAAKMPKGFGPTPAIALCIAALRSRSNKGEG